VRRARFPWVAAQARAIVALAELARIPALAPAVEHLIAEPRAGDADVAGVPTTLVRPARRGPWPALVFVNGVTARGRHHPEVQRLARALARAGYVTAVPDLPGLSSGELTQRLVRAAVAVTAETAARTDVLGGRAGLFGVSLGASVALLAAEDPELRDSVSVVGGLAPYANLANVLRLATTGTYADRGRLLEYRASETLTLVAARSIVAGLPEQPDRGRVSKLLPAITDEVHDPLHDLETLRPGEFTRPARTVVELLVNRDPDRFDELYAALPTHMREEIERLSPLTGAARLRAPVELASAPRDGYFPLEESRALLRVLPAARLTVTSALAHAQPRLSLRALADFARLDLFAARILKAAAVSPGSG